MDQNTKLLLEKLRNNNSSLLKQYCAARDQLAKLGWREFWNAEADTFEWRKRGGSLKATTIEGKYTHQYFRSADPDPKPSIFSTIMRKIKKIFGFERSDAIQSWAPNFTNPRTSYRIDKDGMVEVEWTPGE